MSTQGRRGMAKSPSTIRIIRSSTLRPASPETAPYRRPSTRMIDDSRYPVDPCVPRQCGDEAEADAERDGPGGGEPGEREGDGEALLDDLIDGDVAIRERRAEVERGDVPHVVPELDEPGIVETVVTLEAELKRVRNAPELEPERASADSAHESERDQHDHEDERDRPEKSPDDEGGHAGLDTGGG
jgi:hypothetical protein